MSKASLAQKLKKRKEIALNLERLKDKQHETQSFPSFSDDQLQLAFDQLKKKHEKEKKELQDKIEALEQKLKLHQQIKANYRTFIPEVSRLLLKIPDAFKEHPIYSFVKEFSEHSKLHEGTVFTATITLVSGVIQSIFKLKPFDREPTMTPLGIYFFGDAEPSSGKSPLCNVIQHAAFEAIRTFNRRENAHGMYHLDAFDQKKGKKFNPYFPLFLGDPTAAGVESKMEAAKISSFNIITTEKDFVMSLLSRNTVSNVGLYLKAWAGEIHESSRGNRAGFSASKVFGSMFSLAQVGTVESIVHKNEDKNTSSDGFEARCLFLMEPPKALKNNEPYDLSKWHTFFYHFFLALLNSYFKTIPEQKRNTFDGLHILKASPLVQEYLKSIAESTMSFQYKLWQDKSHMRYFIDKIPIHVQKIAATLHLLECGFDTLSFEKGTIEVPQLIPDRIFDLADLFMVSYVQNHYYIFKYFDLEIQEMQIKKIKNILSKHKRKTLGELKNLLRNYNGFKEFYHTDKELYHFKIKEILDFLMDEEEVIEESVPSKSKRMKTITYYTLA